MLNKNEFRDWENYFPYNCLTYFHKDAVNDILNYFVSFINRQKNVNLQEVLNAMPGHGKTTGLKALSKRVLQTKKKIGLLLVFREKEHMSEVTNFLSEEVGSFIAVDSDNYQSIKNKIKKQQVVLITQERFKNLTEDGEGQRDIFTDWNDMKRIIIVDEMPKFVESIVFNLVKGFSWVDDCYKSASNRFQDEFESNDIRCLISDLFTNELKTNHEKRTRPLSIQNQTSHEKEKILNFINIVEERLKYIQSIESRYKFRWFKKLYFEAEIGYIDPEIIDRHFRKSKGIICAKRIDYSVLGCSIIIMDGTAAFTPTFYEDFTLVKLTDYTRYERLIIHQRQINTSKLAREKPNNDSQLCIKSDVNGLKSQGYDPFILFSKSEMKTYEELGVIEQSDLRKYQGNEGGILHIMNTTGKNILADCHDLYLASLPLRHPDYYKKIAIGLCAENIILDLGFHKKSGSNENWFIDEFIEKIYQELIIGEIVQIIHRSSIRKLIVPKNSKVNIFIATALFPIISKLKIKYKELVSSKVTFKRSGPIQKEYMFYNKAVQYAEKTLNVIKQEKIKLPKTLGRIGGDRSIKSFVNDNWLEYEGIIRAAYQQFGLDIIRDKKNGYKNVYQTIQEVEVLV